MDKKHTTVESLLEAQQETSLTTSERSLMLSELRSYAAFHTASVVGTSKSTSKAMSSLWVQWSAVVGVVAFLIVGTGAASTQSLPGESLYSVKVAVVEPMIGLAYVSDGEQLYYQVRLLKKRVDEIQQLTLAEELDEESAHLAEEQITYHANDITTILRQSDEEGVSASESVEVMSDVVSVLRTQEIIVKKELGKSRKSEIDETKVSINSAYMAELNEFVLESPEEVSGYIEEALSEINSDLMSDETDMSGSVQELGDYLNDIEGALSEGDLRGALLFTGEAKQTVDSNKYLEEFEEEVEEGVVRGVNSASREVIEDERSATSTD